MSLRVFIAHAAKERESVFERTLKLPKFSIIYAENGQNGEEVAREILEKGPDIAVFDAVMSHADGLSVMEKISGSGKHVLTIVLMSAHNAIMESELLRAGATYVFVKPVSDEVICKRIISMSMSEGEKDSAKGTAKAVSVESAVTGVIHELGVPAHIKGYDFLRRAIMLCIEDEKLIHSVTKILYPAVAKHYETTPSRVERAIRHAIEVAFDRGDVDTLERYFGYTIKNSRGKPTNSEFIALISDNMRMRLKSAN